MNKIQITFKRIGLSEEYKVNSLKNRTSFKFGGKTYKTGDRITEKELNKICKNEGFNATVRGS